MTEQQGSDQYIKCSSCKCKYINDDDHIKKDFGYNRLNEIYKTCVKCREYRKQRLKRLKDEAIASEGKMKHCNRCYKNKAIEDFVCPNGKSYNACYSCLDKRYNQNTIENILDS